METAFNNPLGIISQPPKELSPLRFINVPNIGINPPLFNTNKRAFVDSVLNANQHLDWVQRLRAKNAPSIQVKGEPYRSTHLMSDDGNGYVFPTIIKTPSGALIKLSEDEAHDYAKKTKTGIQLPRQQGTWLAANGYKIGTGVNNDINPMGIPYNNPKYKL